MIVQIDNHITWWYALIKMIYLKTKYFHRWAKKNGISDSILKRCIAELNQGLYEASLGHKLYKKRLPVHGRGKRGGARTILYFKRDDKLIFCMGFSKNVKTTLETDDIKILRRLSYDFDNMNRDEVERLIELGSFVIIDKEDSE